MKVNKDKLNVIFKQSIGFVVGCIVSFTITALACGDLAEDNINYQNQISNLEIFSQQLQTELNKEIQDNKDLVNKLNNYSINYNFEVK